MLVEISLNINNLNQFDMLYYEVCITDNILVKKHRAKSCHINKKLMLWFDIRKNRIIHIQNKFNFCIAGYSMDCAFGWMNLCCTVPTCIFPLCPSSMKQIDSSLLFKARRRPGITLCIGRCACIFGVYLISHASLKPIILCFNQQLKSSLWNRKARNN